MNMILIAVLAVLTVDFNKDIGPVRRELHSAGFGPQICSCPPEFIRDIQSMGFRSSRTHDWALLNANERVCDYFHMFPLMHLDAKDPKNYVFAPTDYLLKRTREELGHDVFFRLGTSIEHSGPKVHFNALVPEDFDKLAEVFAGTIRHYNRGWANGFAWGIRDWEIWNEPEGVTQMWCAPEGVEGLEGEALKAKQDELQAAFVRFFVTVLRRLKDEFGDTIRVGGPALQTYRENWFRPLLEACRSAGVAPDFISWHHYAEDPDVMTDAIAKGRALCDEYGFTKCGLVINEWHYFSSSDYGWAELRSPDPEVIRRIWSGPRSHNGIDASCFNLAVLSLFQTSKLDQGFYYGCRNTGDWGYMDVNKRKYKVYSGLRLFGDFMRGYTRLCAAQGENPEKEPIVTVLAGRSADGRKRAILVSAYRVREKEFAVDVKGVPAGAQVTAVVHDDARDTAPADFTFADGKLTLRKSDGESAAFLVTFEDE